MENMKQEQCEKILSDVKSRQELKIKAEYSKELANYLSSKKVMIATIVSSALAGIALGEFEVLAHSAEATLPAVAGMSGAIGGAIASVMASVGSKGQAKIDCEKAAKAENREIGR